MDAKNLLNKPEKSKNRKNLGGFLDKEFIKVLVVSAAIVVFVKFFIIQPFSVHGQSMEPNFYEKEHLIVDEISYRFREPERGETIVFRNPRNIKEYYIKRIIGLPGETVNLKDGIITIYNQDNPGGFKLEENYLPAGLKTTGNIYTALNAEEFFVLGDNRLKSLDSRYWGNLDKKYFIGKVWARYWPISEVGVIKSPNY